MGWPLNTTSMSSPNPSNVGSRLSGVELRTHAFMRMSPTMRSLYPRSWWDFMRVQHTAPADQSPVI